MNLFRDYAFSFLWLLGSSNSLGITNNLNLRVYSGARANPSMV